MYHIFFTQNGETSVIFQNDIWGDFCPFCLNVVGLWSPPKGVSSESVLPLPGGPSNWYPESESHTG